MGSVQTIKPTPSNVITIPSNYPTIPTPGKLELLLQTNSTNLYHKFSPYSISNGFGGAFTQQPFYYTFIDQANQGINADTKHDSRIFPLGSTEKDVIRITKFLASGRGLVFLAKQFLLQTGNPYNETRIYNPTSPIVAAGMPIALGSVRPQRNFDTSGGLVGLASTLIGNSIPDAIFGTPTVNPPSGTVQTALSDQMLTIGGKGLLRAGTANRGMSHLQAAWPQNTRGSGGLSSTFGSVLTGLTTSLFANFLPATQNNVVAKSDEGAYGMMVGAGNSKFNYISTNGGTLGFGQQWIAGGGIIRKTGQYPSSPYRLFMDQNGNSVPVSNDSIQFLQISGVGDVGYTIQESNSTNSPGVKYGDSVGVDNDKDYGSSDVMLQYEDYVDQNTEYSTKKNSTQFVSQINTSLQKVLSNINKASEGTYQISVPNDARVISSGNSTKNGYDRLFATAETNQSPFNYPFGVLMDYRSSKVVDNTLTMDPKNASTKLPTAGKFDAINTLKVLDKDMKIDSSKLKGWNQWNPYIDDQIALYFYDVVNEKYIPFRAAIKGPTESVNSTWEELSFIGRADKVYSYGGFNRTIAFTLSIVIGSIAELASTWQRINYLMTLGKPSNYTTSGASSNNTLNNVINRFLIPPMVMITIGDLYKNQPVLIQSVVATIEDDSSWETQNEKNTQNGWSYLANYMTSEGSLYGQLPRNIEIAFSLIALEKERPIAGGANFGDAPRTDDWSAWNTQTIPDGGTPSDIHKSLVVDVSTKTNIPAIPEAGSVIQQPDPLNQINQSIDPNFGLAPPDRNF